MPNEHFLTIYIMVRTSYIPKRCWWCLHCISRPTGRFRFFFILLC